ncbi:MAG: hypothetical protein ACLP0J_30930 [Solirubrobacteraceae bacterium]
MTENTQSATDQAQPPVPWLKQPDAGFVPNWAQEGEHPGPSWPPSSIEAAAGGAPAGQSPLRAAQASLQALARDRPEAIVGAAFAGGLVLALILKRLAR